MAGKISHIIKKDDDHSSSMVFTYEPKKFPVRATSSSTGFIKSQKNQSNDFKISELVAEQTGIAEEQRKQMDLRVEEETLHKLKFIEEKAYKEAYELGLIEGTEKAFRENSDLFSQKLSVLDDVLARMENFTTEVFAEKEAQILHLITQVASKIAMFEIQSDPKFLLENIENLFHELKSDQRVILRLNEEDALFVETLRERTDQRIDFLKNVKIEIDEDVDGGGCILESNYGAIDATIEQRVNRVWGAMQEKLPLISEKRIEMAPDEFVESVEVAATASSNEVASEDINEVLETTEADAAESANTATSEESDGNVTPISAASNEKSSLEEETKEDDEGDDLKKVENE